MPPENDVYKNATFQIPEDNDEDDKRKITNNNATLNATASLASIETSSTTQTSCSTCPLTSTKNNDQDSINEEKVVFEDLEFTPNLITKLEIKIYEIKSVATKKISEKLNPKILLYSLILFVYNIYFFGAIYNHFKPSENEETKFIDCCNGIGFLIIITATFYLSVFLSLFATPIGNRVTSTEVAKYIRKTIHKITNNRFFTISVYVLVAVVTLTALIIDTADNRERLVSAFGILALAFIGFVFSKHPGRIVWNKVFVGLIIQVLFGLVILRTEIGRGIFQCMGDKVTGFLQFTDAGSSFVYGPLVTQQPFMTSALNSSGLAFAVATEINSAKAFKWILMFKVLSTIYFLSFFISMLFYMGWMQWVVIRMGKVLQFAVGSTACESMNAAANIFLGHCEAALMIKPYIHKMTNSELHAVMTGGFATVAGAVLAAYISFGISASHLLSASVMSAPALSMAKILYPETKKTKTLPSDIKVEKGPEANILDAASQGAVTAVFLIANIAGSLIAVFAFTAFLNGMLSWFGGLVGLPELTFELVLGKMFIPMAWLMGVPAKDLDNVGVLLGIKTFISEFLAYERMFILGDQLSPRSRVIATYALCGFSNPANIGMQIASLGTMAPIRRSDLARVAFRAYVAGSLACFLTACVAGMLVEDE